MKGGQESSLAIYTVFHTEDIDFGAGDPRKNNNFTFYMQMLQLATTVNVDMQKHARKQYVNHYNQI